MSVLPREMVDGADAEPSVSATPEAKLFVMNRLVAPKLIGPVSDRLWFPVGSSPAVPFAVIKPKFMVIAFAIERSAPIGLSVGGAALSMETVPEPKGPAAKGGPARIIELTPI